MDEVDTIISNSDPEVNDTETLPVAMKLQLAIEASLKIPKELSPSHESIFFVEVRIKYSGANR